MGTTYRPGDAVEVRTSNGWRPAEVLEVGRSVGADQPDYLIVRPHWTNWAHRFPRLVVPLPAVRPAPDQADTPHLVVTSPPG